MHRAHRRVTRLGYRLREQLDDGAVEGPVRRRSFGRLAHSYLRGHEALLATEEGELFPVLASSLEPVDWLEATTVFQWYFEARDAPQATAPQRDLRRRIETVLGEALPAAEIGLCPLCAVE